MVRIHVGQPFSNYPRPGVNPSIRFLPAPKKKKTFPPPTVAVHIPPMAKNYWLVKQEPEAYSWSTFVKEGGTAWTGVRNYQARNNLRAMKKEDLVAFYHSVSDKEIVGLARVTKEFYPDPTATEGDWSVVHLAPVKAFKTPVSLETIKTDPTLKEMPLVKQTRLSVVPMTKTQFDRLMTLAQTKP